MNTHARNQKVCLFCATFNTHCFVQENVFANDERSCQGRKEVTTSNSSEQTIAWTLEKKDVDIASKDNRIHENFNVCQLLLKNMDSTF